MGNVMSTEMVGSITLEHTDIDLDKRSDIVKFIDKKHAFLRLFEAVMGASFLILVTLVADIKEAGYGAILVILVPAVLIVDGLVRFLVLKDGIVIDSQKGTISYPKNYSRDIVNISDITSVTSSKTLHSGPQFGVTVYSYDVHLHGNFGNKTLIFSSKKAQDEVLQTLRSLLPAEEEM
jgi:hypothetical protein